MKDMQHFVLIYDRSTGRLLRHEVFDSSLLAMQARFRAEAEFRGERNIEVAALEAASEETLRKTHGRYFLSLDELVDRIG